MMPQLLFMTLYFICNIHHHSLALPNPWFGILWPALTFCYPKPNITHFSSLMYWSFVYLLSFIPPLTLSIWKEADSCQFYLLESLAHALKELGCEGWSRSTGRERGEATGFFTLWVRELVPQWLLLCCFHSRSSQGQGFRALLTQLLCWSLQP